LPPLQLVQRTNSADAVGHYESDRHNRSQGDNDAPLRLRMTWVCREKMSRRFIAGRLPPSGGTADSPRGELRE
jgi:hypothetical protein